MLLLLNHDKSITRGLVMKLFFNFRFFQFIQKNCLLHKVEFYILYFYIMSYAKLLSPERKFVYKINNEMHNNSLVNSDEETRKDYFFSLVNKNKELSENEKEFCKEGFIYWYELRNARDKEGKPKD